MEHIIYWHKYIERGMQYIKLAMTYVEHKCHTCIASSDLTNLYKWHWKYCKSTVYETSILAGAIVAAVALKNLSVKSKNHEGADISEEYMDSSR